VIASLGKSPEVKEGDLHRKLFEALHRKVEAPRRRVLPRSPQLHSLEGSADPEIGVSLPLLFEFSLLLRLNVHLQEQQTSLLKSYGSSGSLAPLYLAHSARPVRRRGPLRISKLRPYQLLSIYHRAFPNLPEAQLLSASPVLLLVHPPRAPLSIL